MGGGVSSSNQFSSEVDGSSESPPSRRFGILERRTSAPVTRSPHQHRITNQLLCHQCNAMHRIGEITGTPKCPVCSSEFVEVYNMRAMTQAGILPANAGQNIPLHLNQEEVC